MRFSARPASHEHDRGKAVTRGKAMLAQVSWLWSNASDRLRQAAARFGTWWLQGFLSLFPAGIAQWLVGPGSTILLLLQDDAFLDMRLTAASGAEFDHVRVPRLDYTSKAIDAILQRHQLRLTDVTIGIGLPAHHFFKRKLVLPFQAANSIGDIVARDLAQKTPFSLADIHHDHTVVAEAGKLMITQHVTRRDSVSSAASAFGLDVAEIDFVEAAPRDDGTVDRSFIALHPKTAQRASWVRRMTMALATSTLVLALIAGGLKYWRQEVALEQLKQQIAIARQQAQQVRGAFAKLEQRQHGILDVYAKKQNGPALLDIWDEVTRLLPTDTWLTDLHVTETLSGHGYLLSLSGYSAAAAKLVAILDRSPLFEEAVLTTAIAVDQNEQRERFALQTKVRIRGPRSTPP
jgi:general secretion pathway protein L